MDQFVQIIKTGPVSGLEWQISTLHLKMANAFRFGTPEFMRRTINGNTNKLTRYFPQWSRQFVFGKSIHLECPYPTLRCDSALAKKKENYLSILLYEM